MINLILSTATVNPIIYYFTLRKDCSKKQVGQCNRKWSNRTKYKSRGGGGGGNYFNF